jgi:TrmH family RNA methyltransferase
MKTITSPSNERIKHAVGIRKGGFGPEAIFIEGARVLATALNSPDVFFKSIFVTAHFISKKDNEMLVAKISARGAECFVVPDEVMKKLSDTQAPQGAVALARMEVQRMETIQAAEKYFIVALDGVSEPGNVGAVLRAADAFGADAAVALGGTANPFSPKVARASAGGIFNIPVIVSGRIEFIKWCRAQSISIMAANPHGGTSVFDADLTKSLALVLGGEAAGVSSELESAAHQPIHVPMKGRAESLNVAQTAAVCLYECQRQRRTPGS